uniref:Uncharacterized protein n=1 Tax=Caenorhabditis japonica TaxID=281687 RepID=A0A8R1DZJ7_CAEJA
MVVCMYMLKKQKWKWNRRSEVKCVLKREKNQDKDLLRRGRKEQVVRACVLIAKISDDNGRKEQSESKMRSQSSNFTSPTNSTTPLYGLATPDTDCEVIDTLCPQLTRVFHVSVNGSPRLAVWKDVENNDTLEIVDEAGYVAEWPGYCGTADGALVEMYSPILATIRYVSTNEEIERARWNTDRMFWRPTKVLGYLFDAKEPKRTVKYPFNAIRPFENPVFNKISITLRPIIRVKSPSGYVAFTTSFRNNEYLVDYKFDKVFNVSLVDQTTNVTVIGDACGQMTLLYEVFDPTKMTYRLKTPASLAPTEEMVKRAGYVFREESSARRCLEEILPIYEFQNPKKPSEIHYAASMEEAAEYSMTKKWTNLGQLGFSSWGSFAFAKR